MSTAQPHATRGDFGQRNETMPGLSDFGSVFGDEKPPGDVEKVGCID
jgi:hypothetical protein